MSYFNQTMCTHCRHTLYTLMQNNMQTVCNGQIILLCWILVSLQPILQVNHLTSTFCYNIYLIMYTRKAKELRKSDEFYYSFFYVLHLFRRWAMIVLHNFLFILALHNICSFTILPTPYSAINLHKLSR